MLRNVEVNYTSGDLYKALRASIAIPGVFTPVLENGQFLVDGGVVNPLPLNLVRKKKNELIMAVNLNGPATLVINGGPELLSCPVAPASSRQPALPAIYLESQNSRLMG
ncbi:patatin-like phospholipase family protein [Pontibacter virosus]|uniref:patatin-like phospholipase family protein n=1 Tax=Pontibacter virosus TaxID=1765052 RepID=UPI001FAF2A4A|nr:patatin-like phospholipase family protein [Pontibacter virosus]